MIKIDKIRKTLFPKAPFVAPEYNLSVRPYSLIFAGLQRYKNKGKYFVSILCYEGDYGK